MTISRGRCITTTVSSKWQARFNETESKAVSWMDAIAFDSSLGLRGTSASRWNGYDDNAEYGVCPSGNTACIQDCTGLWGGAAFVDDCGECVGGTTERSWCRCGDGVVQAELGEVCDDGNVADGDYCASDCKEVTGRCGDEILQTNELCELGEEVSCANVGYTEGVAECQDSCEDPDVNGCVSILKLEILASENPGLLHNAFYSDANSLLLYEASPPGSLNLSALKVNAQFLARSIIVEGSDFGGESFVADIRDGGITILAEAENGSTVELFVPVEVVEAALEGFAPVTRGTFTMGSPVTEIFRDDDEAAQSAQLSVNFLIALHEFTVSDWDALSSNPRPERCPACPVNWASLWEVFELLNLMSDAAGYQRCFELSECVGSIGEDFECENARLLDKRGNYTDEIEECEGFRLPTEAEWEYAYRAGTETALYNGQPLNSSDLVTLASEIGWHSGNSGQRLREVGQLLPNDLGLFDMAGNAHEWVYPAGGVQSTNTVIRGGGALSDAQYLRAASRVPAPPAYRAGFRAVLTRKVPDTETSEK